MSNQSLEKNCSVTIQPFTLSFLKGINQKVNLIERLEFELVYNDVEVHHINPSGIGQVC